MAVDVFPVDFWQHRILTGRNLLRARIFLIIDQQIKVKTGRVAIIGIQLQVNFSFVFNAEAANAIVCCHTIFLIAENQGRIGHELAFRKRERIGRCYFAGVVVNDEHSFIRCFKCRAIDAGKVALERVFPVFHRRNGQRSAVNEFDVHGVLGGIQRA